MTETRVVALCGSRRGGSHTRAGLQYALAGAEGTGAAGELIDLRELDLPPLKPDDPEPADAEALTRTVRAADAVLLGTPMYHGSYSGVLKNALDYCGFDEFDGKTVGLLAVAGGSFPVTALDHLRSVCRALDAWVLPHQAAIPQASGAFIDAADADAAPPRGADAVLADEDLRDRVETLGVRAVRYADIESEPATFESEQNVGADG
ncbi:MAG: NADPH-dependent FMN reductase [Halobacteriaceae archaeon]